MLFSAHRFEGRPAFSTHAEHDIAVYRVEDGCGGGMEGRSGRVRSVGLFPHLTCRIVVEKLSTNHADSLGDGTRTRVRDRSDCLWSGA